MKEIIFYIAILGYMFVIIGFMRDINKTLSQIEAQINTIQLETCILPEIIKNKYPDIRLKTK